MKGVCLCYETLERSKGAKMENLITAITIIGGLALFIFGMNLMSDGLQKVAGNRMQKLLGLFTGNPLLGVLSGAIVAAVLQSSSATTVMILGFIGAGMMKLPQAICVIMGANIGGTVTAQLVAFHIGDYAWILVIVGFILLFPLKRYETSRNAGQVLMGFGMLFVGMNVMAGGMAPVAASPYLANLMVEMQNWPVMGVLIGTVLAFVIQSSTAGIGLLQSLASTAGISAGSGIVSLGAAIPIVFGFNIGTTILLVVGARNQSINARRAVLFHFIFNTVGTLLFVWFVPQISQLISAISPSGLETEIIARQIANTHLLFNVAVTLIFLPFVSFFVWLLVRLIPGDDVDKPKTESTYLDQKMLNQPAFAIHLATEELLRIGGFAMEMMNKSKKAFLEDDLTMAEEVMALETAVNRVQDQTVQYLAAILANEASNESQAKQISGLLHISADIEHIGDYCTNLAELAEEKNKHKFDFSDRAMAEISDYFDQGLWIVRDAMSALEQGDSSLARDVVVQETQMNQTENRLRKGHMQRLNDNLCSPAFTVVYNDVIHNIEKIGDCSFNIAEAVLEDQGIGLRGKILED
jgi:phosphate:Na+ symporter